MHTHRHLVTLGAFALLPSLAFADVLVNWGNNVTADTAPNNEHIVSGAVAFSLSTPRSPSSANYNGSLFYGGAAATATGVVDRWFIDDAATTTGFPGGSDLFNFRVTANTAGDAGYALLLWKQEDFQNLSGGDVTVTDFSFFGRVVGSGISGDVRFVVKSNGVTLVSAAQALTNSASPAVITLSDLSSQSWFLYDPASSLSTIGASYDVSGFSFSSVSLAGVLLHQERPASTGTLTIVVQSFTLDGVATVVPEPSTFAALAGLFGLAGAALRRRRP